MSVVRLALAVITIPVLTHSLGLSNYGIWAVLISILSLTSVLQFGLAPAVTVQVARVRSDLDNTRAVLGTSFLLFAGMGVLAGLVLWLGAHPIAMLAFWHSDNAEVAEKVLPLLGIAACAQFLRQWVMAAEAGLQRYDMQAWADGLGSIALYGGLVVLARLGAGLAALATWWGLASIGTLFGHWYIWRTRTAISVSLKQGWNSVQARALLHFGVRQWTSQLGGSFFGQMDRLVVNLVLGSAAAGLYSVGTSVAVRINELSAAPIQVVGPALAGTSVPRRRAELYKAAQSLNLLLAYMLAAIIILGAEPLARFLVPAQADTMGVLLRVLGVCYGLYSINAVAFYAAQGIGQPSINSRWVLTAGAVFLLALAPLARTFGIRGAAWANLGYALTLGINLEVVKRLALARSQAVLSGVKLLVSLVACYFVSSIMLTATDDPLVQSLVAGATLASTGGWIFISFLRARELSAQLSDIK